VPPHKGGSQFELELFHGQPSDRPNVSGPRGGEDTMRFHEWLVLAAVPLAAACAHEKPAVAAAPEPPAPPPAAAPAPPPAPEPMACAGDDQCGAKQLCISSRCEDITAAMDACRAPGVHFDFDRSDLHPGDLPKLQRAARCLNALPEERTLVEGNCDERGTAQYNIALGFRRAHAVAGYLEGLGVPKTQLSEVSYGKELPLCADHTETCWAENRRADVERGAEPKDVTAMLRADEKREKAAMASTQSAARHPSGAHRAAPKDQKAAAPAAQ
jgi:peptidoglycan-associated lipoprotein